MRASTAGVIRLDFSVLLVTFKLSRGPYQTPVHSNRLSAEKNSMQAIDIRRKL